MAELSPEDRSKTERSFVWLLSAGATVIAFLPAIYALSRTPAGSSYLGFEYNTDDHMVYAAWMHQAMNGHVLMDNRFTTDPQPGLTIHLYFFALGLLAKIVGIPVAASLGRAVFSVVFVHLAAKLVKRLQFGVYGFKLALSILVVGAGLGFLLWQNFGVSVDKPPAEALAGAMAGFLNNQLPIDVWQPEGFVFPSMLTNGLFMVSLCLIVFAYLCFLDAKENVRSVIPGFVAMFVLMNIHSYDILTIGLVMVGFLAASLSRRQVDFVWVGRAAMIALGVAIPALWFVHVLQNDPVFQARAATETYSPNFRQVLLGYCLMIVLGLSGAWVRASADLAAKTRRQVGVVLAIVLFLGLAAIAGSRTSGYFLSQIEWAVAFVVAVASVALAADENPAWNLVFSWAILGTVAIYFPGLFQRKLTMGLSVPWAILAAFLVASLVADQERYRRNLATILALVAIGASSFRWLARDIVFIRNNVANTTRHPVYLSPDERKIIGILNDAPGRNVLLALPGSSTPNMEGEPPQKIPDSFASPLLPDLAPICSGLAGVYSYAGHWSETPDYGKKASDLYHFFFNGPFESVKRVMTDKERAGFVAQTGATYAILPSPAINPFPLISPVQLGKVVYNGSQFILVKLRRP